MDTAPIVTHLLAAVGGMILGWTMPDRRSCFLAFQALPLLREACPDSVLQAVAYQHAAAVLISGGGSGRVFFDSP
jgi:hypothetical protein